MRTILVAGTDLFSVASRELGDAAQWYRIAALTGVSDPMIYGLVTLQIPEFDASAGNGLPSL